MLMTVDNQAPASRLRINLFSPVADRAALGACADIIVATGIGVDIHIAEVGDDAATAAKRHLDAAVEVVECLHRAAVKDAARIDVHIRLQIAVGFKIILGNLDAGDVRSAVHRRIGGGYIAGGNVDIAGSDDL